MAFPKKNDEDKKDGKKGKSFEDAVKNAKKALKKKGKKC